MDGANISNVTFSNVSIRGRNIATPLFVKVGNRASCEDNKGGCFWPGSISDVVFSALSAEGWGNVSDAKPGRARFFLSLGARRRRTPRGACRSAGTSRWRLVETLAAMLLSVPVVGPRRSPSACTGNNGPRSRHRTSYTATIEGLNATYRRVGPLRFESMTLRAPGGGAAEDVRIDPPNKPLDYQPRLDGVRPSYGMFVRYARDIVLANSTIGVGVGGGGKDGRPAIVADQVDRLVLENVGVEAAGGAGCQLAHRGVSGTWAGLQACPWAPNRTNSRGP